MKTTTHKSLMAGRPDDTHMDFASIEEWAEAVTPMATVPGAMSASSWTGGQSGLQAVGLAQSGDRRLVPVSDELMAQLEDVNPPRQKFVRRRCVAGGAVNVGAFLAGTPECMVARVKQVDDAAPIALFVDVVSSASLGADALQKRGTAILALVRLLSIHRPVSLYVVAGMGGTSNAFVTVKIDTAPMDLGRACHMLTSQAVSRHLIYKQMQRVPGVAGEWAYRNADFYRTKATTIFNRTLGIKDALYLAPPHTYDPCITNQVQWVKDMLAKFSPVHEA